MNTFNLKSVKIMDLLLHFQIYFTQEPLIPIKKKRRADNCYQPFVIYISSIRDLQDSSACQQLERQEFPGTPSDLYLQG
jgi:hypothetical protein